MVTVSGTAGRLRPRHRLHDYGARIYCPEIGRFISPDTAGPDLPNPATFNRYGYVLSNSYKYVDPTGKWPTEAWGGAADLVHKQAIQRQLGGKAGAGEIAIMQRQQLSMDSKANQAPDVSTCTRCGTTVER